MFTALFQCYLNILDIVTDVSDQLSEHVDPLLLLGVSAGHRSLHHLSPRTPHVGEDRPAIPLPLIPGPDALEAEPDYIVEAVIHIEGVNLEINLGQIVGLVGGRYRSVALQPAELLGTT